MKYYNINIVLVMCMKTCIKGDPPKKTETHNWLMTPEIDGRIELQGGALPTLAYSDTRFQSVWWSSRRGARYDTRGFHSVSDSSVNVANRQREAPTYVFVRMRFR